MAGYCTSCHLLNTRHFLAAFLSPTVSLGGRYYLSYQKRELRLRGVRWFHTAVQLVIRGGKIWKNIHTHFNIIEFRILFKVVSSYSLYLKVVETGKLPFWWEQAVFLVRCFSNCGLVKPLWWVMTRVEIKWNGIEYMHPRLSQVVRVSIDAKTSVLRKYKYIYIGHICICRYMYFLVKCFVSNRYFFLERFRMAVQSWELKGKVMTKG